MNIESLHKKFQLTFGYYLIWQIAILLFYISLNISKSIELYPQKLKITINQ